MFTVGLPKSPVGINVNTGKKEQELFLTVFKQFAFQHVQVYWQGRSTTARQLSFRQGYVGALKRDLIIKRKSRYWTHLLTYQYCPRNPSGW